MLKNKRALLIGPQRVIPDTLPATVDLEDLNLHNDEAIEHNASLCSMCTRYSISYCLGH